MKKLFNFKNKKDIENFHENRVKAMKRLAQHKDFVELVQYWEIEYNRIDNRIDSLKGRELEDAVRDRGIIKKHLSWISSMTT